MLLWILTAAVIAVIAGFVLLVARAGRGREGRGEAAWTGADSSYAGGTDTVSSWTASDSGTGFSGGGGDFGGGGASGGWDGGGDSGGGDSGGGGGGD